MAGIAMIRKTTYAAQLREDVDEARTGDKVDAVDPAAAPLGTDDEAAGKKTVSDAVAVARETERKPSARPRRTWPTLGFIAAAGLAAFVLSFLVVFLLLSWEGQHGVNRVTPHHVVPERPAFLGGENGTIDARLGRGDGPASQESDIGTRRTRARQA
jgi:hypothetical protein